MQPRLLIRMSIISNKFSNHKIALSRTVVMTDHASLLNGTGCLLKSIRQFVAAAIGLEATHRTF